MPAGTITQVTTQAQPAGQTQLKSQLQQQQQSQPNQSMTSATFSTQNVNGIRIGTTVPTLIAQNTGQIIASTGAGPQQQANVLLNQALGPIQTPNNQPQILTGPTSATATLVSQGQQSAQIHFNNQNVSLQKLIHLSSSHLFLNWMQTQFSSYDNHSF